MDVLNFLFVFCFQIPAAPQTQTIVGNGYRRTWGLSPSSCPTATLQQSFSTFHRYFQSHHVSSHHLTSSALPSSVLWMCLQMEALPYLTVRQIAEATATPGQLTSAAQVNMVMDYVPNQQLPAFFDDFSPVIMVSGNDHLVVHIGNKSHEKVQLNILHEKSFEFYLTLLFFRCLRVIKTCSLLVWHRPCCKLYLTAQTFQVPQCRIQSCHCGSTADSAPFCSNCHRTTLHPSSR